MNEIVNKMAKDFCLVKANCNDVCNPADCCQALKYAEKAYEEGYRKQSEGEWETIPDYQPNKLIAYRHICSVCKTTYKDIRPHGHKYCHECGAKMKGEKQ